MYCSGRGIAVAAAALLFSVTALAGGCKKEQVVDDGNTNVGGSGGDPIDALSARDFYLQFVHNEIDAVCGVCHQSSEGCVPKFMAETAEGSYQVLKDYEGLVTHAVNSNLLYHGAHTGPALTEFQDELIVRWLEKEFANDDDPPSPTLDEALQEIGNCMEEQDFETEEVYLLAYQQSEHGPCGSCHRTGEAGTWIGFQEQEMYDKNSQLPFIKRLVKPTYDGDNRFDGLVPSNRFVEKVESATTCGSPHAGAQVPADMEARINNYVGASLDRWRAGACSEQL